MQQNRTKKMLKQPKEPKYCWLDHIPVDEGLTKTDRQTEMMNEGRRVEVS
jgi:hypothetical protein